MKLKIHKDGKEQNYNLIKKWSDVNLKRWAELISMRTDTKSNEALDTIKVLTDIPTQIIKQLALSDVSQILSRIALMQSEANTELVKRMTIDGIEYGFHPNLDDITLGEYADIETLIKEDLRNCMPDLMAILFRPITEDKNGVYSIAAYDGNISVRREVMKEMSGEQVQNAMVFFWTLGKGLLRTLQLSLMEQTRKTMQETLAKPLEKDGVGLE
jgi:hypothetical protein